MANKKAPPADTDAWIPENPGEQLVGTVLDVDVAWSDWRARANIGDDNAGWYPLLTIKRDDNGEEVKLHGFRTVLYNELAKRQPIPGERITVTYKGAGEAKSGMNPPELYNVHVEGRSPEAAKGIYASLSGRVLRPQSPTHAPEPVTPSQATLADDDPDF